MLQKHAKYPMASESHVPTTASHKNRTENILDNTTQEADVVWTCLLDALQSLSENVLLGYMRGVQRRGRQPKRWTDNITEWTGLSISDAEDKIQDHDKVIEWSRVDHP